MSFISTFNSTDIQEYPRPSTTVSDYYVYPLTSTGQNPLSSTFMANHPEVEFIPYVGLRISPATARLTDMSWMFAGNPTFNDSSLSKWDISAVTNFDSMFDGAGAFDQDISKWVPSLSASHENFDNNTSVLWTAEEKPRGYGSNIVLYPLRNSLNDPTSELWRSKQGNAYRFVPNVGIYCKTILNMDYMFAKVYVNNVYKGYTSPLNDSDFSTWNLTSVTSMVGTFAAVSLDAAENFNGSIQPHRSHTINVSVPASTTNVTTMRALFANNKGNVGFSAAQANTFARVTDMSYMFAYCSAFNKNISDWNIANVTNISNMFAGANVFDQPIGNWNTANVTNMSGMFASAAVFNQPIGNWNTANVTNMSGMFENTTDFNQPISNWNTANVTNMSYMFATASAFNQPISNWNTANVTNMSSMFRDASGTVYPKMVFNQPLSFDTGRVTNMSEMFSGATAFNKPLSFDTSRVTNMSYMFKGATAFNQPIGNWNTANVTNMSYMFSEATAFNQSIGNWNTANVTDMSYMFAGNRTFNQPIGNWNTGNVTNMSYMFSEASAFNQSMLFWNTANVTDMSRMFHSATSYNHTIADWDTGKVTNINGMFQGSSSYYQNLSSVKFTAVTSPPSGFSTYANALWIAKRSSMFPKYGSGNTAIST